MVGVRVGGSAVGFRGGLFGHRCIDVHRFRAGTGVGCLDLDIHICAIWGLVNRNSVVTSVLCVSTVLVVAVVVLTAGSVVGSLRSITENNNGNAAAVSGSTLKMSAPVDWRQVRIASLARFPKGDVGEVLRLGSAAAIGSVETVKVGRGRVARTTPVGAHVLGKHRVAGTGRLHDDRVIIQFGGD